MRNERIRQRGVTLVEVLAAITIIAAVTAGAAELVKRLSDDTSGQLAAQHMKAVGDAAQAYIKNNYSAVMANATVTQPALITVPMLTATGYLNGTLATNGYNQTVCILVLQPTAGNLQAMVIAEGGTTIDDSSLGGIAAGIGGSGGGIYASDATTIRGAMGGWSIAIGNFANANNMNQKCDGTAGTPVLAAGHPAIALWFENGDSTAGFLYRNTVPGRPELNTMNTPLVLGAGTVQTAGNACTTTGALGRDASGVVLSCQSGTWQQQGSAYWKDPVANAGSLPACNAGSAWQTRIVQTPSVGSGPRAYTCNGASWQALAVNDAGQLTIPGTLTVGGSATIAGNATVSGSAAISGDVAFAQAQINSVVTENTACAVNGKVARDAVGLVLSCQSGIWKKASGDGGKAYDEVTGLPEGFCGEISTKKIGGIFYANMRVEQGPGLPYLWSGWQPASWGGCYAGSCGTVAWFSVAIYMAQIFFYTSGPGAGTFHAEVGESAFGTSTRCSGKSPS